MSISVVIPAYNAERFIHVALNSLLNQTVLVDEIIVVDDGSTDSTFSLVTEQYPRVKLFTQQNSGPSAARNKGFMEATSDFIMFLDADDEYSPSAIEEIKKRLTSYPDVDFFIANYSVNKWDKKQNFLEEGHIKNSLKFFSDYRVRVWTGAVCIRKNSLLNVEGFDIQLKNGEDINLWVKLLAVCKNVYFIDVVISLYRNVNIDSITSNYQNMDYAMRDLFLTRTLDSPYLNEEQKRILKEYFYNFYKVEYLGAFLKRDYKRMKNVKILVSSFTDRKYGIITIIYSLSGIIKRKFL